MKVVGSFIHDTRIEHLLSAPYMELYIDMSSRGSAPKGQC